MMKKRQNATKKAFTLTELSLALAFVGALFIMIATIVANMISIYQKGTTITNINNVGRSIITDMTTAITESPTFNINSICNNVAGENVRTICKNNQILAISVTKTQLDKNNNSKNTGGAFCTGKYSYIWNSGYVFSETDEYGLNKYRSKIVYQGGSKKDFRLIKIEDNKRLACLGLLKENNTTTSLAADVKYVNSESKEFNLTGNVSISEDPVELIAESDKSLALYSLDVYELTNQTTKKGLYDVSFTLGTIRGGPYVVGSDSHCKAPGDADSDFEYCAINKFNFATRTTGE